jgi:hypothetical protein
MDTNILVTIDIYQSDYLATFNLGMQRSLRRFGANIAYFFKIKGEHGVIRTFYEKYWR